MKAIRRLARQSPALIVAMIALFVALTGTAVATTSALVTGAQIKNNSITGLDVKNKSLRPIDFRGSVRGPAGPRGQTGVQGAQGIQGIQGVAGPGAQWATVSPAGTVLRQSGGITAAKVQTGGYRVTFPEEVSGHLVLVTLALASDQTTRGTVIAGPCVDFAASCGSATIPNSVSVFTLSTTGVQQDHAFTVAQMGPSAVTPSAPAGAMRSERLDPTLGK